MSRPGITAVQIRRWEALPGFEELMRDWEIPWQPFEEARAFAQILKLKNRQDWREYCTSGKKPKDIPSLPERIYKDEFKGFGDWLGTGRKMQGKRFRAFTKARAFAQSLRLEGQVEWTEYCTSGKKPQDLPRHPHVVYKDEFKGYGDWLGTGNVREKDFRTFKKARAFVQSLKLKNTREWYKYRTSKPSDIPSTPHKTYRDEFKGYGDWLGTKTRRRRTI